MNRTLFVTSILLLHVLHITALAADSQITTYYWDGDWVQLASWKTNLQNMLFICLDAGNFEEKATLDDKSPAHNPGFWVEFDNIKVDGNIIDDFEDEDIDKDKWCIAGTEGTTVEETDKGVLKIAIANGKTPSGYSRLAGLIAEGYVRGYLDVQVEFKVNDKFHDNHSATTNAKLILTDGSGHSVEAIIRSGAYMSYDICPPRSSITVADSTSTDHTVGKLRITRTEIAKPDDPDE